MSIADSLKEKSFCFDSNDSHLEEAVDSDCKSTLAEFKKVTRFYALFNISFFAAFLFELVVFLLFFSFFTKSSLLAFALAGILLTAFSYFVLLFYFQAKKPDQLFEVRKKFIEMCKLKGKDPLFLTVAAFKLIDHLDKQECTYYPLPKSFKTLEPLLVKFSTWTHWKDVHQMKETLLFFAIEELISIVKLKPLDLETHSSLGDAFKELSKLYTAPTSGSWIPSDYHGEEMRARFKIAAEKALVEFKIVDHFAPKNVWVHAKLASIYSTLNRKEEEIKEYEAILSISPHDKEALFRLGVLYFEQGHTAQALEIYEQLRDAEDPKAQDLIAHYI